MLHFNRLLAAVCVTGLVFASCQKDPEKIEVSSITLYPTELTLEPGNTAVLKAAVAPENADYDGIFWASDNVDVATVENGTVTAVSKGTATITATVEGKSATCKVTVKTSVAELKLSHTEVTLEIGKTQTLTATVLPEDAEYSEITWKTDNASVATVDAEGVVTSVAEGTATITASTGDKSASCKVTVVKAAVIYVTGYDDKLGTAFRWTRGDYSATDLSTDPNQATKAFDITLSGDDVYIGGCATNADGYFIPTLWKNGQAQTLMDASQPIDGEVQSVSVSGNDVYAAGWYRVNKSATTSFKRDAAVVWKNGSQIELANTSYAQAFEVRAEGSKVYACGFTTNSDGFAMPTLWTSTDGLNTFQTKTFGGVAKHAYAEGLCVSGDDVYMVGYGDNGENRSAMLWKNDEAVKLLDNGKSYAYSVTVADGHVYVVGYVVKTYENGECAVATLWVDGVAQSLTEIKKDSQAWDVFVKNGNIYVSGFIGGQIVVWENGVAGAIRYGSSESACATGIYVK